MLRLMYRDDDASDEDPEVEDEDLDAAYHARVARPSVTFTSALPRGIPSEVVVGGRVYPVEVFTTGGEPTNEYDRLYGRIGGLILLNSDTPGMHRDTLLHEVLHAVDFAAGTEAGEAVVEAWAPVILDALRRNPSFVAYLLADETPEAVPDDAGTS